MKTTLISNRLVKQNKAFESRIQIPQKHIQYLLHHTLVFSQQHMKIYYHSVFSRHFCYLFYASLLCYDICAYTSLIINHVDPVIGTYNIQNVLK